MIEYWIIFRIFSNLVILSRSFEKIKSKKWKDKYSIIWLSKIECVFGDRKKLWTRYCTKRKNKTIAFDSNHCFILLIIFFFSWDSLSLVSKSFYFWRKFLKSVSFSCIFYLAVRIIGWMNIENWNIFGIFSNLVILSRN